MNIVEKKLNDIKPYEKNPRINDDAVKYVAEILMMFLSVRKTISTV